LQLQLRVGITWAGRNLSNRSRDLSESVFSTQNTLAVGEEIWLDDSRDMAPFVGPGPLLHPVRSPLIVCRRQYTSVKERPDDHPPGPPAGCGFFPFHRLSFHGLFASDLRKHHRGGGGPGAGSFTFWIGLATTIWGAIYHRQALQNRDFGKFIPPQREQRAVLAKTAVSILAYLALMPFLGFLLTSFLLLLYHLKWIGGYRMRFALPFALAATALISYCFQVLLYISLPRGLIGW
jgi:hypothetical protein